MRRDDAYLLDMLLSARDAVEFVSGITYADFEASRLRRRAQSACENRLADRPWERLSQVHYGAPIQELRNVQRT